MSKLLKVAIAADHGGFDLKESLRQDFAAEYEWVDLGTYSVDSVNYPDYAHALAAAIEKGEVDLGVLICGTGIGISMAANRHKGVRAALCTDATMARLTREHNDANVLALGARITGYEVAADCLKTFMSTEFEGGRHQNRIDKIEIDS